MTPTPITLTAKIAEADNQSASLGWSDGYDFATLHRLPPHELDDDPQRLAHYLDDNEWQRLVNIVDRALRFEPPLRERVLDVWGEDPDYHKSDWKLEVANDDTHAGYWEWVEMQREQEETDGL